MQKLPFDEKRLKQLKAAATREINMRKRVYKGKVWNGTMSQEAADTEIKNMQDIEHLLQHLIEKQAGVQTLFDNEQGSERNH